MRRTTFASLEASRTGLKAECLVLVIASRRRAIEQQVYSLRAVDGLRVLAVSSAPVEMTGWLGGLERAGFSTSRFDCVAGSGGFKRSGRNDGSWVGRKTAGFSTSRFGWVAVQAVSGAPVEMTGWLGGLEGAGFSISRLEGLRVLAISGAPVEMTDWLGGLGKTAGFCTSRALNVLRVQGGFQVLRSK